MKIRLTNHKTGQQRETSLDEAAQIMQLETHDILWAIEEEGICSTDEWHAEQRDLHRAYQNISR